MVALCVELVGLRQESYGWVLVLVSGYKAGERRGKKGAADLLSQSVSVTGLFAFVRR
jgi:hypothetical protein